MTRTVLALLALVFVAGCASSGIPSGTVLDYDLVGQWRFDAVVGESIRGVVTFTEDDRYAVQCNDDTRPPVQSVPLGFRGGRVQWSGCGAGFQTFRDESGAVVSDVSTTTRTQVRYERYCSQTAQRADGSSECIAYAQRPIYRDTRQSDRITMERVLGGR